MMMDAFLAFIEKRGAGLAAERIQVFEAALGCELPHEYKLFLAACNGGYVNGRLWFFGDATSGERCDAGIAHIAGLRSEPEISLDKFRSRFKGRIPVELLCIMDDPFGSAICIGLVNSCAGKVYFWDLKHEDRTKRALTLHNTHNLTEIAPSFNAFIDGVNVN